MTITILDLVLKGNRRKSMKKILKKYIKRKVFAFRSSKKKSGLRLSDLNPEVRESLLRGNYSVYIDMGIRRTWFGFLRKSEKGQCVYTLDRRLLRDYPQQFRMFADCKD